MIGKISFGGAKMFHSEVLEQKQISANVNHSLRLYVNLLEVPPLQPIVLFLLLHKLQPNRLYWLLEMNPR